MLGPHAFQCLELSEDSSCSDGEEADDEGENDFFSSSSAESSRLMRREDEVYPSSASSGRRKPVTSTTIGRHNGDYTGTENNNSPRRLSFSGVDSSPSSKNVDRDHRGDIGGGHSDPPSNPTESSEGPQTPPKRAKARTVRCQSTPPVVLTAEACADWCRTQPGFEAELILMDDHVGGNDLDCVDNAARTIKRMEMLVS